MYKISRNNYEAAEQFLLSHSPKGFKKYSTITDVHEAVGSLLTSFKRHPQSSFVSCGALLLLCDIDDNVEIYVDPSYSYQEPTNQILYGSHEDYAAFELV